MESLMNGGRLSSSFPYKPCSSPEAEEEPETEAEATPLSGILDVYVHEARDIHNICIYANQDVYAKFSLTCSPDEALSTQVIKGGGKNPHFNELLHITIPHRDAVLKCEIWMLSRARNYLEDQLLGFALVPLSLLMATPDARLAQDFTLSSTDLFHSPAGTVQLTLSLDMTSPSSSHDLPSAKPFQGPAANSASTTNITSEVVLLNPEEYRRIEFPDIGVATENQQMVSEYFDMTAAAAAAAAVPFVHLRASSSHQSMEDYDMTNNASPDESFQHSTATSLTDDRNSADSMDNKKCPELCNVSRTDIPGTPTSERDEEHEKNNSSKEEASNIGNEGHELGSVFKSPLGNINLEDEQSAMQQQIVDMYMRSMQQFTESLAKMKLPMDLDNPKAEDGGDVIQSPDKSKLDTKKKKKKEGSRVFYGSRAFF